MIDEKIPERHPGSNTSREKLLCEYEYEINVNGNDLTRESGIGSQAYESNAFNKVFKVSYEEIKPIYRETVNDYKYRLTDSVRIQSLAGFDEGYTDIVDYILKFSYRIWQENDIGLLYSHYANNTEINNSTRRLTHGIAEAISETTQLLYAFPDSINQQQKVIWSGDDKEGFYSSHKSLFQATNKGNSTYGPATEKRVNFFVMTDCVVYRNRIIKEWLVRDGLHLVKQLGFDPVEVAKELAKSNKSKMSPLQNNFGMSQAMEGQYPPPIYKPTQIGAFEIGDFILEMFNKIHEWKMFGSMSAYYAENAMLHYICEEDGSGLQEIRKIFIGFHSSFANAQVLVERVTCNPISEGGDYDVAVRWRVMGVNDGIGFFGEPSYEQIEILVITHLKIVNCKIVEEWMIFDGMDVLRQMYQNSSTDIESNDKCI